MPPSSFFAGGGYFTVFGVVLELGADAAPGFVAFTVELIRALTEPLNHSGLDIPILFTYASGGPFGYYFDLVYVSGMKARKHPKSVIPANVGIQENSSKSALLDHRVRGDDVVDDFAALS